MGAAAGDRRRLPGWPRSTLIARQPACPKASNNSSTSHYAAAALQVRAHGVLGLEGCAHTQPLISWLKGTPTQLTSSRLARPLNQQLSSISPLIWLGFLHRLQQQHGRGSSPDHHLRGALRASQLCSRINASRCPASSSSSSVAQSRMRVRLQASSSSGSGYTATRSAQSATGSGVYDPRKKVVVVGGGWAGFGAAKHLAEQGYAVTLLEAAKNPGGLSGGECVFDGAPAARVCSDATQTDGLTD